MRPIAVGSAERACAIHCGIRERVPDLSVGQFVHNHGDLRTSPHAYRHQLLFGEFGNCGHAGGDLLHPAEHAPSGRLCECTLAIGCNIVQTVRVRCPSRPVHGHRHSGVRFRREIHCRVASAVGTEGVDAPISYPDDGRHLGNFAVRQFALLHHNKVHELGQRGGMFTWS